MVVCEGLGARERKNGNLCDSRRGVSVVRKVSEVRSLLYEDGVRSPGPWNETLSRGGWRCSNRSH